MLKLRAVLFDTKTKEVVEQRDFDIPSATARTTADAIKAINTSELLEERDKWKKALQIARWRLRELINAVQALRAVIVQHETPQHMPLNQVTGVLNAMRMMNTDPAGQILTETALLHGVEDYSPEGEKQLLGDWFYELYRTKRPGSSAG